MSKTLSPERYKLLAQLLSRIKREYGLEAIGLVALHSDPNMPLLSIFNNIQPGMEAEFLMEVAKSIRDRQASFYLTTPNRKTQDN